ncbi:hypothetical protein CMT41_15485 [Colwellia sp. MT41]|uniref:oligosaccharide flippase family protein n=1 Tax=Colwellia sp. MT41 TaxID=58049 RepID=UPI000717B59E|nr:oligosaccharide flippase family protein [Colwellia sp. MT41]ALO35969.1 hypothetical protein CMT41_15485 [Colwellia sp. MT41]
MLIFNPLYPSPIFMPMSKILRSTVWTTASTVINIGLLLLQLSILTRYISADVFGQIAIINLFIEIFTVFALGGVSNFVIYKKELTQPQHNSIFLLALASGFLTFIIFFLLAPVLAFLWGIDAITVPLQIIAVILPISAMAAQYQAVALKRFLHATVAKVEIVARFSAFIIALLTIELGLYCLVSAMVSYQLFRLLGFIFVFSREVNFSLKFETNIIKEAVSFGTYDIGGQALNIVRRQLDVLILSLTLPLNELGIYHIIKQLASRPAQALQPIVNKIAFPAFSQEQKNIKILSSLFVDIYTIQWFALALFYAPMVVASELVAAILFGSNIAEYHWVLSALALFWCVRVGFGNLTGPLTQAVGKTKFGYYWNLCLLPLSAIIMFLSAQFGLLELAITLFAFKLCLLPAIKILVLDRIIKISFMQLIKPVVIFLLPLMLIQSVVLYAGNMFYPLQYHIHLITLTISLCSMGLFYITKNKQLKNSLIRLKELA